MNIEITNKSGKLVCFVYPGSIIEMDNSEFEVISIIGLQKTNLDFPKFMQYKIQLTNRNTGAQETKIRDAMSRVKFIGGRL